MNFSNFNIRQRLIAGFAILIFVLITAVGITRSNLISNEEAVLRIANLRTPTANASAFMVNNINASLAALRGWMLTGNENFKVERAAVWKDIDKTKSDMDVLSRSWTNPANKRVWSEFKDTLAEFRQAQQKVEDIAHSADEQPALQMLLVEAAPRAAIITSNITKIIDEEITLQATPTRKAMLGMMADVRGTMGLGLANIRAMLLTGDSKFQDKFNAFWAKNDRRFKDLSDNRKYLTSGQKAAFDALSKARAEFAPLPNKMFAIRGSNQWNMANYTLIQEAAPRAGKLLTILAGAKNSSGQRNGGMVVNQRKLLTGDVDQLVADMDALISQQWLLLAIGLFIAAIATFFTARSIVDPIKSLIHVLGKLSEKDFTVEVTGVKRGDEVGDISRAVDVFKDASIENERLQKEVEETRIRDEKATIERRREREEAEQRKLQEEEEAKRLREAERKTAQLDLADKFEQRVTGVMDGVSSAATELYATSQTMSQAAESTQDKSLQASSATEQTSANVQTVAAAAEEMSASISEIGRQVSDAARVSQNAVQAADDTANRVSEMETAAAQIGQVVQLINDISEQTNLLALNATIEAARAGEAGRGFAVVASEVKSLANQTANATNEIAGQITGMQTATKDAVVSVNSISKTIQQISEISSAIASAVEEQSSSTQEISRNVNEAAQGTENVSQNIGEVNNLATEASEAANGVNGASADLSKQAEILRVEVDTFLNEVRTG